MQQALRYRSCLRDVDQIQGSIHYAIDVSKPVGQRITSLAYETGLDDIHQIKDHGDGTATYAFDLSHRWQHQHEW